MSETEDIRGSSREKAETESAGGETGHKEEV